MMKRLEGGVTAAKGFQAAGIYAGIKKNNLFLHRYYKKNYEI